MRRILYFIAGGMIAFILVRATYGGAQKQHTLTGNFRMHNNFHSKYLDKDRDIIVYLPPEYDKEKTRRYPVFYMQDGQNLFDGATSFIPGMEWRVDETAEALIKSNAIEPIIIVGIYNTGEHRADEYTPTKDPKNNVGGKADLYGRMLVEELKPFIDSEYRTLTDPANTGLGGSSLGGLVSLYVGIKYPNTFGKLAVISPSVWWDNRVIIREVQKLASKLETRIWIDMGTEEGKTSIDEAKALRDALIVRGWSDSNLNYFEAQGAKHNEEAWAQRMESILKYLFPNIKARAQANN
jgi:predicted alpha/beta superfamily hydrolase